MGLSDFFSSMEKAFQEESKRSADRMAYSRYRNVVQSDEDYYNQFAEKSDGELLRKYNSPYTSEKDKRTIAGILESRGYEKHRNGTYGRR